MFNLDAIEGDGGKKKKRGAIFWIFFFLLAFRFDVNKFELKKKILIVTLVD